MKKKVSIAILLSIFLFGQLLAQYNSAIRLYDRETEQPIQGASFEYGDQRGQSDESGQINFRYVSGQKMLCSHIVYGAWEWSADEIATLAKVGAAYRSSLSVELYPVTVIGVKPVSGPSDKVNIQYQDKLQHDGGDVLNQIPAFNSIRKGGNYGFDPVFRGFKYDQLNIVLNGAQCASAACPNRMDPPSSQMAPNMMERIEVLKGPYSLRYGVGLGATVNFVSTPLHFTDEADTYGRVSSSIESNGAVWRNEGQIGLSGKNHDFSLFGAWAQGDDYKAGNQSVMQADFERASFGANLGLKIAGKQQLRLGATYNRARDTDFPALAMDLRKDDTWLFNARHDVFFNGGNLDSWNTTLYASLVDHFMDNRLKIIEPRMMDAETPATTFNYGLRTEGAWRYAKANLYAGVDVRIEGAEGTRSRIFLAGPNAGKTFEDNVWQKSRITKTGLFGEYSWRTDALNWVLSGRLEMNQAEVKDPAAEFLSVYENREITQFNPNLSVGATWPATKEVKIGLWAGRVQRSGSLNERYINFFPNGQDPFEIVGNPEVKPEVNYQSDLTFAFVKGKSSVTIDVFYAYLNDFISSIIDTTLSPRLSTSPGVRRIVNIDKAYKTGFELNWVQNLGLGLEHQLGLAYTYAQDIQSNSPLPEIAPFDIRYALKGSYFRHRFQPQAKFRYVLEQSRISTQFGEKETPAFTLLDVQAAYMISPLLSVQVGINNIFDENYYEHLNRAVRGTTDPIYARGRNYFVSVSWKFE